MAKRRTDTRIIQHDPRHHMAFPTAVALEGGDILLAFRRARDHRHLLGPIGGDETAANFDQVDHLDCRSHIAAVRLAPDLSPRGPAWSLPTDREAAEQDANLIRLKSGRLLQTGFRWYPVSPWIVEGLKARGVGVAGSPKHHGVGFIFWGGYARWSDDEGAGWSDDAPFPTVPGMPDLVPGVRPYLGGPIRGRPVQTADGTVLQASYAIRPDTGRGAALLHASSDEGADWEYRGVIAEDARGKVGFLEPALAIGPDDTVVALHRTTGAKGRLALSLSRDRGASWEAWRLERAVGHPFDALLLDDGRVLVTYGRRHPPFGVRARIMEFRDGEPAFGREIVVRADSPSPDVGYPWSVALPDGRVAVFHYLPDENGVRHIAATVISV